MNVLDALGPDGFGTYAVEWTTSGPTYERVSRPPVGLLIPGFVDLHVHGAYGHDLMSDSPANLKLWFDRMRREGYEAMLPTTVASSAEQVLRTVEHMPDHPIVPGFHLEGPFLSPKFPGAQPQGRFLVPAQAGEEWEAVWEHPKLKIVTLAPELPGASELISKLRNRGVRVQLGHTDATFDECRNAVEFGATGMTHTFNAMRGMHHRELGAVGYALLSKDVECELIYDRRHVDRRAVELLLRARGSDAIIAVSDCTMAAGMPPNTRFEMWGMNCESGRKEVRLADTGTLAGSAITLFDAFCNLMDDFGAEMAIRSCCLNPRRVLGLCGPPRVYVELDTSNEIVRTFERSNASAGP